MKKKPRLDDGPSNDGYDAPFTSAASDVTVTVAATATLLTRKGKPLINKSLSGSVTRSCWLTNKLPIFQPIVKLLLKAVQ
jgi:hypothetical protein